MHVGTGGGIHWQVEPLRQVVTTMPEGMLLFTLIGLFFIAAGRVNNIRTSTFWHLILVWLAFPILRLSIPTGTNFDGIRHYLEFLPAAAIIAGHGLNQSIHWVSGKKWMTLTKARSIVLILYALNLLQAYSLFYPYMHLYYNQFTGGLSGARDRFLGNEATDYWAGSYRHGMEWLSKHAPRNSNLVVPVAGWVAEIQAPLFLRPDINIVSSMPDFSIMRASPNPYYIMFILRGNLGNMEDEVNYIINNGDLTYQVVIDQVPLLYIYRFGGN